MGKQSISSRNDKTEQEVTRRTGRLYLTSIRDDDDNDSLEFQVILWYTIITALIPVHLGNIWPMNMNIWVHVVWV